MLAAVAGLLVPIGSSATAAGVRTTLLPDFIRLEAVQRCDDGGACAVGLLRTNSDAVRSAFVHLRADGTSATPPIVLAPPDDVHTDLAVSSLLRLRSGDFVAAGWASAPAGKPCAWMTRFRPDGATVWNGISCSQMESKIYTLRQLRSGDLLGIGRIQAGQNAKQPSHGYLLWVDRHRGHVLRSAQYAASPDTLRSGFQDAIELGDGSLIATGWTTRTRAHRSQDDIWAVKLSGDGSLVRTAIWGEAGDDVGWAVSPWDGDIVIAGLLRKSHDEIAGMLAALSPDLSGSGPQQRAWSATVGRQVRSIAPIPSSDTMVFAGESAGKSENDTTGLLGLVRRRKIETFAEPSESPASRYRALTVTRSGTIIAVGDGAQGSTLRGAVGTVTVADLCTPDSGRIAAIANALAHGSPAQFAACAAKNRPLRIRLAGLADASAIFVRPVLGQADAVLMRGNDVIDSSLNRQRTSQILVPPKSPGPVELVVSARSPLAVFEVGRVSLAHVVETVPSVPVQETKTAYGERNHQQASVDPRIAGALRVLGYQGAGLRLPGAGRDGWVPRRTVVAFQIDNGYSPTGVMDNKQLNQLFENAANRLEPEALEAAQRARRLARSAAKLEFPKTQRLRGLWGAFSRGQFYGVGEIAYGTQGIAVFDGIWLGGPGAPGSARPAVGILELTNTCSVALRNFADTESATQLYDLRRLLKGSIGVIRINRQVLTEGDVSAEQGGARNAAFIPAHYCI